ncbi:hypothetical protein RUND412_000823 [Rhizina undulata]
MAICSVSKPTKRGYEEEIQHQRRCPFTTPGAPPFQSLITWTTKAGDLCMGFLWVRQTGDAKIILEGGKDSGCQKTTWGRRKRQRRIYQRLTVLCSNNRLRRTQPLPSMRAQRPNVQTSPPPLSPILPSTPNGNEIRRTNHGNAQTLGPLVAKIHNMVQELNGIVDMKFCPNGNIHNGVDNNITNFNETVFIPARRKMTGTEFYSMDSIRSCLEGVHEALGMRVEALRRSLGNNEVMSVASISSTTSTPSTAPQDQAYAANLSTLQHRVSTLSLAHETLQKEHNNLLSAFSRSQTRAGTLEKKISVSTEENENLSNERERLQGNLEVLEEEVVDLRLERDDARKELAATRSQWIGILKGAGKLERKSEQDKAEFRSQLAQANKREAELRERLEEGEKAITRLQEDLELLDCNLTSTGDLNATSTAPGIDAVDPNSPTSAKRDASLSILRLKKRNEKLRVRISQLEDCIKEFRDHNAEISATADKFMKMGWEAVKKANGVLTGCASPIVIEDEDWRPTGRTERH